MRGHVMSSAAAVEAVFFAALEKGTAAERAAYLESACGADAELRRQVEKMLNAHPKVGNFLDNPAVEQLGAAAESSDATHEWDTSSACMGPTLARTEGGEAEDDADTSLDFLQPSTRPDSLGRIGHYEVLQVLGKGGFGIVFRAFDDVLKRVVALKVLAPAIAATSPARKRFLREARSSAQVRHENVVQVYAVEERPLPYLVMEFVPGETLQQRLDRTGPLEVLEIVQIGRQIAEGLAAAHATGLIHRDIKPGNVLLEQGTQKVKITDFGLARAADDASLTQSGVLAGTPMYMAPEQAQGEKLDHRADLFSLGSVLYVMASGRPPFRASNTYAVLKRVVEDTPRPIQEVIPEVPQWLCDIIAKLHAKKPADRLQSAGEVADLLGSCQAEIQRSGPAAPHSVLSAIAVARKATSPADSQETIMAESTPFPVGSIPHQAQQRMDPGASITTGLPSPGVGSSLERHPAGRTWKFKTFLWLAVLPALLLLLGTIAFIATRNSGSDPRSPSNPSEVERVRYLSDMQEFDVKAGEARFAKNGNLGYFAAGSDRIRVNGGGSPKGLSMHGMPRDSAVAKYTLGKAATTFIASVAVNDSALPAPATPLTFLVVGDGRPLWSSTPIDKAGLVEKCEVDIRGVEILELRVDCPGDYTNAQAVWLEPRVLLK
jgi:serine/threonine protein kinase